MCVCMCVCVYVCSVCVVCVRVCVCVCLCVFDLYHPSHIYLFMALCKDEEAQLPRDGCMVSSYKGASLSSICELTCIVSQHRAIELYDSLVRMYTYST